jgi:HAD superfamily hydrolase (TIGR01509 family)
MDGLLLDTERLALEAFVAACASVGYAADLERYLPCIGTTAAETRQILTATFGAGFPYDAMAVDWSRRYRATVERGEVPLKTGAREALEAVAASGRPVAIATSTRRALALTKLERTGLLRHVTLVVGGDEVWASKPDPAPYLEATRRLNRSPARCWAVEDSPNGVRAAVAAGLWVVQVPDLAAPGPELRALGHTIVDSLHDFITLFKRAAV